MISILLEWHLWLRQVASLIHSPTASRWRTQSSNQSSQTPASVPLALPVRLNSTIKAHCITPPTFSSTYLVPR